MTEVHITLYGSDAEQFREIQERIAEQYGIRDPSNAGTLRLVMGQTNI